MVYEAKTLADALRAAWGLTGERLATSGTAGANELDRPLIIFPHEQQPTQLYSNSIEVIKKSPKSSNYSTEYFTREEELFEIRVTHNRESADPTVWDQHETDAEDIEEEILRIIKLSYNPLAGIGVYFTSNLNWSNRDTEGLKADKPYLFRVLSFTLTRIIPRKTTAFITYKRAVLLDVSESEGLSLPGSDYQYTEIFNIASRSGFKDHEIVVTDESDGVGIPWHYSGAFNGIFTAQTYVKSTDLGTEGHKINTIWKKLSSGEQPRVTMLRTFTNANANILTIAQKVIFLELQEVDPPHDLLMFNLIGKIIKPGTYTVT